MKVKVLIGSVCLHVHSLKVVMYIKLPRNLYTILRFNIKWSLFKCTLIMLQCIKCCENDTPYWYALHSSFPIRNGEHNILIALIQGHTKESYYITVHREKLFKVCFTDIIQQWILHITFNVIYRAAQKNYRLKWPLKFHLNDVSFVLCNAKLNKILEH